MLSAAGCGKYDVWRATSVCVRVCVCVCVCVWREGSARTGVEQSNDLERVAAKHTFNLGSGVYLVVEGAEELSEHGRPTAVQGRASWARSGSSPSPKSLTGYRRRNNTQTQLERRTNPRKSAMQSTSSVAPMDRWSSRSTESSCKEEPEHENETVTNTSTKTKPLQTVNDKHKATGSTLGIFLTSASRYVWHQHRSTLRDLSQADKSE